MKRALIFLLFLIFSLAVYSQRVGIERANIHFRLTDATNGKLVPLAHVINTGLKKGVIADMQGFFAVPIGLGDTIIINALGYHQMKIPSWGQFSSDSLYYPIRLIPRTYQIREVRITRFGSYQRFIKEVAAMDLPKTEQEIVQEKLEKYFSEQISKLELNNIPNPQGGFTFGTDWTAKQHAKLKAKVEEERKWDVVLSKYSVDVINRLTGLSGIEAIRFMEYCDFTEGFILLASEYEIHKRILDNFEGYQQISRNSRYPNKEGN